MVRDDGGEPTATTWRLAPTKWLWLTPVERRCEVATAATGGGKAKRQAEKDQENANAVLTMKIGGVRPLAQTAATRLCITSFEPNLQNVDTR